MLSMLNETKTGFILARHAWTECEVSSFSLQRTQWRTKNARVVFLCFKFYNAQLNHPAAALVLVHVG